MKLQIKKFDMSMIQGTHTVVMIGARGAGKSFIIKDLLYNHRDIPIGTVISPTESANTFFSNHIPSVLIHDEYTPELMNNVVSRQRLMMKKVNKDISIYGKSDIDPRAFLIMDDCLYDSTWTKDPNIRYIFQNGRHVKLLFVLTMQYPLGIGPNLRTNIDFVFILRETDYSNRKRIFENYAGCIGSFELFNKLLDSMTENYECMVIAKSVRSNKLEDQIYWFKAPERPTFTLGSRKIWQLNNSNEINDDSDDDDAFNPAVFHAKKRGPVVNVKKIM